MSLARRDGVEREVLEDAVQVGVAGLDQLVQPVHELDVRVAPELAEDGRSLDALVGDRIELAEQRDTTDFTHGTPHAGLDVPSWIADLIGALFDGLFNPPSGMTLR